MKQSMSYIRLIAFSMTLSIFSLVSCESGLDFALDKAGENRGEMEKVLEYFRNDLDPLKYEAAQFLISNMPYHYSYSGDVVEQYDSIYLEMAKYPVQKRDSVLAAITENLDLKSARVITDIRSLTADYLIKAINDAFETWKNTPWHETYDKSLFLTMSCLIVSLKNNQVTGEKRLKDVSLISHQISLSAEEECTMRQKMQIYADAESSLLKMHPRERLLILTTVMLKLVSNCRLR